MRKLIVLLMAMCLTFTMMPAMAFAEGETEAPGSQGKMIQEDPPVVQVGWVEEGGGYRYYVKTSDTESHYVTSFNSIKGYWYYFDSEGFVQTGWETINGKKYYFKEGAGNPASTDFARLLTGWQTVGGKTYYFKPGTGRPDTAGVGQMYTGWLKLNGYKYYMDPSSGVRQAGWKTLNGARYYFTPGSGVMATGWRNISGARYYFNLTTGKMTKGWMNLQGARYYLDPSNGKLWKGLKKIGKSKYYLDPSNGKMRTGWQTINKKKYYFNTSSGKMVTGLTKIKSYYYYFSNAGIMKTGVVKIKKKLYYFMKDGKSAKKGWFKGIDKKKRYSFGHGVIAKGKEKIGSTWYKFNSKTGVLEATIGDDLDKLVYGVYSSTTNIVSVSRSNHKVRVYKKSGDKWKAVYTFTCSVGASGSKTPKGSFNISGKEFMQKNSAKTVCWWYCTKLSNGRQFQSILYKYDAKNVAVPGKTKVYDGTLGGNVSNGDIRLALANAQWIYNNLKSGTKVVVG